MTTLGQAQVRDVQDRPVLLETLWAEQPAALIFLRHYG